MTKINSELINAHNYTIYSHPLMVYLQNMKMKSKVSKPDTNAIKDLIKINYTRLKKINDSQQYNALTLYENLNGDDEYIICELTRIINSSESKQKKYLKYKIKYFKLRNTLINSQSANQNKYVKL
jgi:hypothetical protein